jgi:hypothetical protein
MKREDALALVRDARIQLNRIENLITTEIRVESFDKATLDEAAVAWGRIEMQVYAASASVIGLKDMLMEMRDDLAAP